MASVYNVPFPTLSGYLSVLTNMRSVMVPSFFPPYLAHLRLDTLIPSRIPAMSDDELKLMSKEMLKSVSTDLSILVGIVWRYQHAQRVAAGEEGEEMDPARLIDGMHLQLNLRLLNCKVQNTCHVCACAYCVTHMM